MTQGTKRGAGLNSAGFLQQAARSIQLLFDARVPGSLKLMLPAAALLYWVWPIDLIPGLPIDDIAVLIGAMALFSKLAAEAIERQQRQSEPTSSSQSDARHETVVDTTWKVIE